MLKQIQEQGVVQQLKSYITDRIMIRILLFTPPGDAPEVTEW